MVTLGATTQATLVVLNSQKLFHLHSSNWMPASKTKHGAALTQYALDAHLQAYYMVTVHILCPVVCKTEPIFVYP